MTITARDNATLLADGQLVTDQGWVESVKADLTRADGTGAGADHVPAKLEIERHVSVRGNEWVMIQIGQFASQKITFELRGRGIVGAETVEIPIKRPATVWVASGIGVVKLEDAFDKTWELMESTLLPK